VAHQLDNIDPDVMVSKVYYHKTILLQKMQAKYSARNKNKLTENRQIND